MTELSDAEIFGTGPAGTGPPPAAPPKELTDEELFATPSQPQKVLSDADVFGPQAQAQIPAQAAPEPVSKTRYAIEAGKGLVSGAKENVASSLKGSAATSGSLPQLPGESDLEYNLRQEEDAKRIASTFPVRENPLYKAGKAVSEFGSGALKAAPGFEGSWTRDIASGFGSVGGNIATSLLSPGAAVLLAVTAGQGEAVDNAIKAGATEEQIRRAAYFGSGPGATDVVDMLLGQLGTPGKVAGFIARVGKRAILAAAVEGGQEGLQQFLQNTIAKGIYKPDQDLTEDVPRSALIGAIVGGSIGAVHGGEKGAPPEADTAQLQESLQLLRGTPFEQPAIDALQGRVQGQLGMQGPSLQLGLESPQPVQPPPQMELPLGPPQGPQGLVPAQEPGPVVLPQVDVNGVPTNVERQRLALSPREGEALISPTETPVAPPTTEQPLAVPQTVGSQDPFEQPSRFQQFPTVRDEIKSDIQTQFDQGLSWGNVRHYIARQYGEDAANRFMPPQPPSPAVNVATSEAIKRDIVEAGPTLEIGRSEAQKWEQGQWPVEKSIEVVPDVPAVVFPTSGPNLTSDFGPDRTVIPRAVLGTNTAAEPITFDQYGNVVPSETNYAFWPAPVLYGRYELEDGTRGEVNITPIHTTFLGNWLRDLKLIRNENKLNVMLNNLFITRLSQIVPDLPVHIISDRELAMLSPVDEANLTSVAIFHDPAVTSKRPDLNSDVAPHIILGARLLQDPGNLAISVVHEATHAATSRMLKRDPVLRAQVRMLMDDAKLKLPDSWLADPGVQYMFSSEREFIAHAFSDPSLQHALAGIEVSPHVLRKLNLKRRSKFRQAFAELVNRILGLPSNLEMYSMLDSVIQVGSRIVDAQARLVGDPMRPQTTDEVAFGAEASIRGIWNSIFRPSAPTPTPSVASAQQKVQQTPKAKAAEPSAERPVPIPDIPKTPTTNEVTPQSPPHEVLSWLYNTTNRVRLETLRGLNEAVHFEEIAAVTGKSAQELGALLSRIGESTTTMIDGHYLWLARNTRQGTSHMRVQLGNREYTGIKFPSGSERRQANLKMVPGLEENAKAVQEGESKDLPAVGSQEAIDGLRGDMMRLFSRNVPLQVRQNVAHADRMNWLYKYTAGLDQLTRANPNFTPLLGYTWNVVKMQREETQLHDAAVRVGKDWVRLKKRGDQLSQFIAELANMTFRSDVERNAGIVRHPSAQEFQRLAAKYNMDAEMLEVFNKVTTMLSGDSRSLQGVPGQNVGGFLGLIEKSIVDRINRTVLDPQKAASRIAAVQRQIQALRKRPWFPFTHFGRHYVLVKDPTGRFVHFETVERRGLKRAVAVQQSRVNEMARTWERDYGRRPVVQEDIIYGELPEHVGPLMGMPGVLLEEMGEVWRMTPEQINNATMLQLAELSGATAMLNPRYQRKFYTPNYGIELPGYSENLKRSFSRFFFHGAKYYSRTSYADILRNYIKEARGFPGNKEAAVTNFMENHLSKAVLDARGDFGYIRGAMFFWALGYSVAAASTNMTQVPIITHQFLWAKFGFHKAGPALVKAMTQVSNYYKKGTYQNSTEFEFRALDYGIRTGRIEETQATELAGMSQAGLLEGVGGGAMQRGLHNFMQASGWMFSAVEKWNRRITFRAALDLAMKNPNAKYVGQAVARNALEYNDLLQEGFTPAQARAVITAIDVVNQTQYDYSRVMRPKIMRGPVGATALIFKRYIQSTMWMLGHNKDVFWRYSLMMMFIGGLKGLPGGEDAEDLLKVLQNVASWMFGKDFNLNVESRKFVLSFTNGKVDPDILLHGFARKGMGLPALLDLMGSFVTGRPGRGVMTSPHHEVDPVSGKIVKRDFGQSVPAPVFDRSRAYGTGAILPVQVGQMLEPTNDINKTIADQAQKASGAVASVGFNMYKTAASIIRNPEVATDPKTWERAMPRAFGDASEALRAFREGRERVKGGPAGGSTVVTYDIRDTEQMLEAVGIALGYQPLRKQKRWDLVLAQLELEKHYDIAKQGLMENFYEAISGRDPREIDRVREAIRTYNKGLPEWARGKAITSKAANESVTARFRARALRESGTPAKKGDVPIARELEKLYPGTTVDVRTPSGE